MMSLHTPIFPREAREGGYQYRYWLERRWLGGKHDRLVFVMLNPSTATETKDDPTIRKCIGFARRWNYRGLHVVNLFALRATKPKDMIRAGEAAIGPHNNEALRFAAGWASLLVLAWGNHGSFLDRGMEVLHPGCGHARSGALAGANLAALDISKTGQPKHPLYLPYSLKPRPVEVELGRLCFKEK